MPVKFIKARVSGRQSEIIKRAVAIFDSSLYYSLTLTRRLRTGLYAVAVFDGLKP